VTCSRCGNTYDDSANFCPRCGQSPKKTAPYSDFELGRIAAFDTIKKDFWTWFVGGFAALAILAMFGVNEIIKDKVGEAITNHLQKIQKTTDDASAKALQAGAEADVETKKVDVTLRELASKEVTLQDSLDDTDKRKQQLENSIEELNKEKQKLVSATDELQQKESALNKIIKTENLATTFAELRSDHYRVRTLKARVLYEFAQTPPERPVQLALNTISLSKSSPNGTSPEMAVQFYAAGMPLSLNTATGTTFGALLTYEMYPVFEQGIVSHSLTNLDGITTLSLQFGPTRPTPPDTVDSIVNSLQELVKLTKKVTVEIELNGMVLNRYEFSQDDLKLPADASTLIANGVVTFNVSKNVSDSFKDVKSLFDTVTSTP